MNLQIVRKTGDAGADAMLTARMICDRYNIHVITLGRWMADDRLSFPVPVVINRIRYFRKSEVEAWERARAARKGKDA